MATVKFYLEKPYIKGTRPKKLKPSKCSIYLMFTIDRVNRFPMTLDEKIEPKYWDFKNQRVRGTHPRYFEINLYLQNLETEIQNQYYRNREKPFGNFKALVQRKPSDEKKTLFLAYNKFLEAYRAQRDKKTVAKFETLLVRLTDFDKIHPFDLMTLDFNFYDAFRNYLLKIPNPFYKQYGLVYNKGEDCWDLVLGEGEPVGIFDDQVYAYIVQLKTFCKWAEKREYQVHKSYKDWEIIKRTHDPISLTAGELEQLETALITSEAINIGRDYLAFECRTGQRISDIKRFDLKDFSNFKWKFNPKKGNRLHSKTVEVHFTGYCAPALDILQKHNWKMPELSEQKINKNIHKACKAAGIDNWTVIYRWSGNRRVKIEGPKHEFITSHTGRKTFITLGLQAGIGVEYIMQLTGITEYKTIKHYKGKFEDSAVKQELEKIPGTLMRKAL